MIVVFMMKNMHVFMCVCDQGERRHVKTCLFSSVDRVGIVNQQMIFSTPQICHFGRMICAASKTSFDFSQFASV